MSVQESYNKWSETYDSTRNTTRDLDQQATRETFAGTRFGSTLEIGCGTGKNTPLLSQISNTVHAIDFSEAMIEKAKEKTRAGNVVFSTSDITKKWPCEDHSINLISCNLVLEHIENLSFIFAEAYRVLAEKGRFFISELHPIRQEMGKKAHFELNGKTTEIDAFIHSTQEFRDSAKKAGFDLVEVKEWHLPEESNEPPRVISFILEKPR